MVRWTFRIQSHDCRRMLLLHRRGHEMNEREMKPPSLAQQVEAIKAQILRDLQPAAPLPSSSKLLAGVLLLSAVVLLVGVLLLGGRGWHALSLAARAMILAPLIVSACCVAFILVRSTFVETGEIRIATACASAMLALSAAAIFYGFEAHDEQRFVSVGLRCLGTGLLHTLLATAAILAVVRRGAVLRPVLASSAIGALAGLLGVAGSQIRCPNPNELHSLTWHLSLPVIGLLGGMIAGFYINSCGGRNSGVPRSEVNG